MEKLNLIVSGLLLLCTIYKVQGQTLQVVATAPMGQTAVAGATISVTFNQPVDPLTVGPASFRAFGRWSGPAKGQFSFLENDLTVSFQPDEVFIAGEMVWVQLSKGIASATGEALGQPFAWAFVVKAAPGFLDQPLESTIELRLPGEDYLQTYGAYAGDMNNDGYSDLVAVNESSDDLRILLNDGTGHYPSFVVYDTGDDSTPSPSEGADFNNDGEIDLVVTTAWDSEVRVLTGDGLGSFTNMDTYYTSNGVRGVVVGDFNGDGWDDMLTTNRLSGNISIFMNDGDPMGASATFTASNMNLPDQDETACALVDANHDGILDVYYASFNSQKCGVLLGDGNGAFTLSSEMTVQGKPWMIGAADLNGDGYPDLVSANSNSNKTAVLFGDGAGGLSQPTHYAPPNCQFPLAVDIGDIDGDGDMDFVTSNYSSDNYTVFENDGNGQFTMPVTLQAPAASSCAILHDRDNDGDIDITGTDEEADVILLFKNPGMPNNDSEQLKADRWHLRIDPNPVIDHAIVTIKFEGQGDVNFRLTNVFGQNVYTTIEKVMAGNNSFQLDCFQELPVGIYHLEIWNDALRATERILKLSK
jgi:FG-GAP-like repeat/Bacterial Ig-like domain